MIGYDVEATDGHIGKIDSATFDVDSAHVIVDTGKWIFGHKRLVPAGVVTDVDHQNQRVLVKCSKDEIKAAPDYDEKLWRNEDDAYRSSHIDYFGRF